MQRWGRDTVVSDKSSRTPPRTRGEGHEAEPILPEEPYPAGSGDGLGLGEKLLWSGRPIQGLRLRRSDALQIPFSLLWCGFAIFWTYSVATMGGPGFMVLFGAGFVCIGLYLVFGRFLTDARSRASTRYLLTNDRVIVRRNGGERSMPLDGLPELTLSENGDGSGNIRFERPIPVRRRGRGVLVRNDNGYDRLYDAIDRRNAIAGLGGSRSGAALGFRDIEDVRRVHALILDAAGEARGGGEPA